MFGSRVEKRPQRKGKEDKVKYDMYITFECPWTDFYLLIDLEIDILIVIICRIGW